MSSLPVRSEHLEHYLAQYADQYRHRGYSPREGQGRDEIILIQICDRMRTTLRIWKIDRFPLTGGVRDLLAFDTGRWPPCSCLRGQSGAAAAPTTACSCR